MAAPGRIKVAAAQYPIDRLPSMAALEAKLATWVGDARAGGADLVLFPEYGLMEIAGTCDDRTAGDLGASLEAVARLRGEIDDHLARLSTRHGMHILGPSGPARRPDGSIANTALLHAPSGARGAQEKLIMTPFERKWGVTGGGRARVFETGLGRVGVLICYDSEFPLLARSMADAGARLILVPACTERVSGYHRVRIAARARALENTLAAAMSPTIGEAAWSPAVDRNAGAAGVFVPAEAEVSDTGIVAEGRLGEAGVVHAEIDFARLERAKQAGEMRNAEDWMLQPGAVPARAPAELVDLR